MGTAWSFKPSIKQTIVFHSSSGGKDEFEGAANSCLAWARPVGASSFAEIGAPTFSVDGVIPLDDYSDEAREALYTFGNAAHTETVHVTVRKIRPEIYEARYEPSK